MGVPWYVWCAVAATTSSMVGIHWDISWHRSIGRDTFWTPAHVAIYLCGVLAGISCGYLILTTTFNSGATALREASVKVWGFRGPIGAFVAAWGGIAMLTSAPFDDWWHSAYGLDVKIISPPHMVLAVGMFSVQLGALLLVLGWKNRQQGRVLEWLYIYVSGLVVFNMGTLVIEYTFPLFARLPMYYRALGLAIPFFLVALAKAAGVRWAAVKIAAVYMVFWQGMNLVLPLFPAEPKLGPVLFPVKNFVPSFFPIWLVAPAVVIDWVLEKRWVRWKQGLAAGVGFEAALIAVQWPFTAFLMTAVGRHWFFYANAMDYRTPTTSYFYRQVFYPWSKSTMVWSGEMALAFVGAIITAWLGLYCGAWLEKVKR
ncbi:MAG: hypothetical protein JNN08_21525 [Bryobacterales bacterium]|nr:hypothetical protein [Bryobacterales bacterium]